MSAEDKFSVSLIATCILLPLACTLSACAIRATGIDNWFTEHSTFRALTILVLGFLISGISSVLGADKVKIDVKHTSSDILLVLFVFVLVLINIEVFILYIGLYTLVFFVHIEMTDEPNMMSYKTSLIIVGVSLVLYIIAACFLISSQFWFDIVVGFFLLLITPLSILRSFKCAEDIMDNTVNNPLFEIVRNSWLKDPIMSGIRVVKLNFAMCFRSLGDILQEVDTPSKK